MFDFRYHALSLVAVFVALLLGLMLGVAVGDRGLVSGVGSDVRKSLRRDVSSARADSARLRREVERRDRIDQDLYPLLVQGRLAGQRVGLLALGGLPEGTIGLVRDALRDTGGRLSLEAEFRQPVRVDGLPATLTGARDRPVSEQPALVTRMARQFGMELTRGNGPLVQRVRRTLIASSSGSFAGLDSVVLVRNQPGERTAEQARVDKAFEDGLIDGLTANGVAVVGAELTSTQPSQIGWYRAHDLSSVDNVDQLPGRVSLVFALAGATGAYGVKGTAQSLVPRAAGRVSAG